MKKKIAKIISLIVTVMLIGMFTLDKTHYSGSAGADLKEGLTAIYGETYVGKEIAAFDIDGQKIPIYEDMAIDIRPADYITLSPSLQTMLGQNDRYHCQVMITRYAMIEGKEEKQAKTSKIIQYMGYDDGDPNSIKRAWLEENSLKIVYDDDENSFENFSQMIKGSYFGDDDELSQVK